MQPHPDGENTSKRRKAKPAKGEPFIGPIPPDPETGAPRSHITGSSWIRDMRTGEEYANTWDVKDSGSQLQTDVGGHLGSDRFRVLSNNKAVIEHYREVQRQARRAAYAGSPANAVPKPGGSSGRTKGTKTCQECDGSGMVWFGDEEEQCRRCQGTGKV